MKTIHPLGSKQNFELIQTVLDPKVIDGALRSAIHAHGWITLGTREVLVLEKDEAGFWHVSNVRTCSTSSASKRIRGAIRTRVIEALKKESARKQRMWYTRLGDLVSHRLDSSRRSV